MKPTNLDDLVKRYLAGESVNKLAKEIGVKSTTLANWFSKSGVKLRGIAEAAANGTMILDEQSICNRFLVGESVKAIADSLGCCRRVINHRLLKNGIRPRGRRAAERMKWSRMTPEQRVAQTEAAHASVIGRHEEEIMFALSLAGEKFSKRQDGTYHIDLAHHELLVAVEVETRDGFLSINRRERIKYLLDRGWALLYVRLNWTLHLPGVTRKIISLLDNARSGKPVFGKYGVIDCKGRSSPVRRVNLDDFPRIKGF